MNTHTLRRTLAFAAVLSLLLVSSAFAQTEKTFDVELVVVKGKKSVETDADITFMKDSFKIVPDKKTFADAAKEISYSDIKQADQSYSKKPMLSGGGAVVTAVLIGAIFAVPFLFIKKKKHWMTVQTEKEYAVIKLGDRNFRQIVAEFETRGVKVNDLKEVEK